MWVCFAEVDPESDDADEEAKDADGAGRDGGDEGESSSAVIVVVTALVILIVGLLIVVFGLHYKRKLPPQVYTLFSRTNWKQVAGNEEQPVQILTFLS